MSSLIIMITLLENKLYLHCFNLLPQFGPTRLLMIAKYFNNDFKQAFLSGKNEFLNLGLEKDLVESWLKLKVEINLETETAKLEKENISLLTFLDDTYPKLLLEIPKYPPILYVRGQMQNNDELCFGVVGTRKITTYGRSIIPDLITPLVKAGAVIVSGMAFGVDSEAHKIAVQNHKRTIAVLGGGVDNHTIYPKHHQFLAEEILNTGGALISEYPIGTPNFKQNFVARNRIISGLSIGTLVIECDLESGSLITARHALDQNRQVYAVPGPIYSPESRGPNNLLKLGAKAVTEAKDILEDLNLQNLPEEIDNQQIFGDNPLETKLLNSITKQPMLVNELIKLSGQEAGEVLSALTYLELKGKIRNLGGQQYILSR